tara:strand:- start:589 stop:1011 length:423 start_codon:yes stop_codon:yes gene_type:complete
MSLKVITSEKQLFSFIQERFILDLQPTVSKTSRYDCFSESFKMDIELKCRRKHYDDLLIEKKKYDSLMERSAKHNTIPVYINSTPNGIWAFYLKDYDIKWETKYLPKNTDFHNRTKILKEVGYLNVNEGTDLLPLLSPTL